MGILGKKFTDIYGLSYLQMHGRTEAEKVAVSQSHRHNVQRHLRHLFVGLQSNPEDSFRERQQRIFCLMRTLGEYTEGHLVLEDIDSLVYNLLILLYSIETVTLTHDGHHFKESEYLCQLAILENIGASNEHLRLEVDIQRHQCIHQRICVVGGEDYCSVGGNILFSYVGNLSIRQFHDKSHVAMKEAIGSVVILYFLYFSFSHNQCLRK